jgi:signal transduction histidine kinase
VNDILDIEKMEANSMEFALQPLALIPLIEHSLIAMQPYADQYGVKFKLEAHCPEVRVNVDSNRLLQVMSNLLSNAAKFSHPQGVVQVSVTQSAQQVQVAVTDQGEGIPESFQQRIFQKFAQANSSSSRVRGGTGLGLSITKAIIEHLGGQIGFQSTLGVGTTFYFDLPIWSDPQNGTLASP